VDSGLLLTHRNLGYLEVKDGQWTCLACMDRKVRDAKQTLRHEKSEGHTRTIAIRLQEIENSFPGAPDSTEVEATPPTLQQLLFTLDEQDVICERETAGMAGPMDEEGDDEVLDISALSASLLSQPDGDWELGVHPASSLELEGRGLFHLHHPPILFSRFFGSQEDWTMATPRRRSG